MLYDYNKLVGTIQTNLTLARSAESSATSPVMEYYDTASSVFQELSQYCDMTPLLWVQFSHVVATQYGLLRKHANENEDEVATMELQQSTLEMGISAFPGCAMLRLYALELRLQQAADGPSDDVDDKIQAAFQDALMAVGRGSHCNEGQVISRLYRMYASFAMKDQSPSQGSLVKDLFLQRARTPLKNANDGILDEVREFCERYSIPFGNDDMANLDEARRYAAKTFGMLQSLEDDIDVAMHTEQILTRHEFPLTMQDDEKIEWDTLVRQDPTQCRLWNGLGGALTAKAFINYAQTCARFVAPRVEAEEDDEAKKRVEELVHSLAIPIYERGVSECPTVESLWRSYLKHLMYLVRTAHPKVSKSQLQAVANRATRNCPYSPTMFQLKIHSMWVLAEAGLDVLDGDEIMLVVNDAIQGKFFSEPSQYLDVYMAATMTMKRRIMAVLASEDKSSKPLRYDEAENVSKKGELDRGMSHALMVGQASEIIDNVEELRIMYDEADEYLRQKHSSWSEGRTIIWKDRAMTEAFLLVPLFDSIHENATEEYHESFRCFEKLVHCHQPVHPDSASWYIRSRLQGSCISPKAVMRRLRNVRALYQKTISSIGKNKGMWVHPLMRDRQVALHALCQEYLEFERVFGSDESYGFASRMSQKKLEEFSSSNPEPAIVATTAADVTPHPVVPPKRKRSTDEVDTISKRHRGADSDDIPQPMEMAQSTATEPEMSTDKSKSTLSKKKVEVLKVKIGKLEYPAHPFTVRVTNLAPSTEEMDLVDEFRPRCGAVVHAKIIREKHSNGKGRSKGWGLIQFEERESVEKALTLNDVVGIHEKLVQVSRSHVPAAGLVPPGMHRVNPKGEGKNSKRNQKKREEKGGKEDRTGVEGTAGDKDEGGGEEKDGKRKRSVLAFRPRGLAHGHRHHKVKLSLSMDDTDTL